jgi:hypothetical protein
MNDFRGGSRSQGKPVADAVGHDEAVRSAVIDRPRQDSCTVLTSSPTSASRNRSPPSFRRLALLADGAANADCGIRNAERVKLKE